MDKEQVLRRFLDFVDDCTARGEGITSLGFEAIVPRSRFRREFGSFSKLKEVASKLRPDCRDLFLDRKVQGKAPTRDTNGDSLISANSFNDNGIEKSKFSEEGGVGIGESVGKRIKTLEDLISECGVDQSIWEVERHVINKWEVGSKVGDKIVTEPLFQVKAWMKHKPRDIAEDLLVQFEEKAKNFERKEFVFDKPIQKGKLLILNLQDWHLGKNNKTEETGWRGYNSDLAKKAYRDAVQDIILKSPVGEIEKVMLICGSDMLHFDNQSLTTTKGTGMDSNLGWNEMYNQACDFMTEIVDGLAVRFSVHVMMVYGNHARHTEYALGSFLKAFFRNHKNVFVDNRPLTRKYFGFQNNLIGFTHSDGIKLQDLPLIMMRENQDEVSKYRSFTMLCGHTHTDRLIDIKGVRVMVCPALCSPDKYHVDHGYVGNVQAGQGLIFSDKALEQIIYSEQ